jgi:hypothetical protein
VIIHDFNIPRIVIDPCSLRALCRLASIRVNELIEKELLSQSFCNFWPRVRTGRSCLPLIWSLPTGKTEYVPSGSILSAFAGSGWVSSHSARAMTVGSIPALSHHAFITVVMNFAVVAASRAAR